MVSRTGAAVGAAVFLLTLAVVGGAVVALTGSPDGEAGPTPTATPTATATVTPTATATRTPEPTPEPAPPTVTRRSGAPTAVVEVSSTTGQAPLRVAFRASGSRDPQGDLREFIWRFDDGGAPRRGVRVDHTFRDPGRYVVSLVVVDGQGYRDVATVVVRVQS
jgi:PKD repeat protein